MFWATTLVDFQFSERHTLNQLQSLVQPHRVIIFHELPLLSRSMKIFSHQKLQGNCQHSWVGTTGETTKGQIRSNQCQVGYMFHTSSCAHRKFHTNYHYAFQVLQYHLIFATYLKLISWDSMVSYGSFLQLRNRLCREELMQQHKHKRGLRWSLQMENVWIGSPLQLKPRKPCKSFLLLTPTCTRTMRPPCHEPWLK